MKITVHGGRALLVISDGATAHVEGTQDTKAILLATNGSMLQLPRHKEPIGASFTNGSVVDLADTDSAWLVEALKFLGFTLRKRKPLYKEKSRGKRRR